MVSAMLFVVGIICIMACLLILLSRYTAETGAIRVLFIAAAGACSIAWAVICFTQETNVSRTRFSKTSVELVRSHKDVYLFFDDGTYLLIEHNRFYPNVRWGNWDKHNADSSR